MRLQGRVASITGSGSGIGRAAALLFAAEGARILVSDVDVEAGKATVAAISDRGGEAHFVAADVSRADDVEALYAEGEELFGKVDVLFNNAGIFDGADGSVTDTAEGVWDRVVDVDLKGVFLCCKYGVPALQRLLATLQPVSLIALLTTLLLLFGFQGEQIIAQPLIIALLAAPILIQVYFNSGLAYFLNRATGEAHCVAGPSALIGASMLGVGVVVVCRARRRGS